MCLELESKCTVQEGYRTAWATGLVGMAAPASVIASKLLPRAKFNPLPVSIPLKLRMIFTLLDG